MTEEAGVEEPTALVREHVRSELGRLGPYRLKRQIGEGSSGQVFEAVDADRELLVALKKLSRVESSALQQLKSEFRNLVSVEHRNLVRHYELMEVDGSWFFTMELLAGSDLRTFVAQNAGTCAQTWVDSVKRVFSQLAAGIAALHRQDLVHLDIKPANVFVEPDGRVVLLDFGVSGRSRHGEGVRTRKGTPRYMAPEQVSGAQLVPATDWYAFGLLLFEALSGTCVRGEDPYEALEDPLLLHGVDTTALPAGLPAELRALCISLLQGDPTRRPTPSQILGVLDEATPQTNEALPKPTLVGREASLEELRAALRDVASGTVASVHVVAESGGGKSFLVAEFLDQVRTSGEALVLSGRCYEWESVPYKGLDAVVDELAAYLNDLGSLGRRALQFSDYDEVSALFPVLRQFTSAATADVVVQEDGSDHRRIRFRAFREMLRNIARARPVVCFIDDAHWSDTDSALLLIEALSFPNAPRVLLILAYRPTEAARSTFLDELNRAVAAQLVLWTERRVNLSPLSDAETSRLVAQLMGERADGSLCFEIARESRGNPFFVEELVRSARASRSVTGFTLDSALRARIDRLSADARRALQVIAVAGRLPEQDIALIAGGASRDPHRVLSALRLASLVRTSGPRATDGVEPYHDRIRECLVATLAPQELSSVHRALATTLETRSDAEPHVLSVHFEGAGEVSKARSYAVAAAERAVAVLAFDSAAASYARALSLDPSESEMLQLLAARGRAMFNAGRGAEAGHLFLQAARSDDALVNGSLRRRAVESFLTAGRVREGLQVLTPLCQEAGLSYRASNHFATLAVFVQLLRLLFLKIELTPHGRKSSQRGLEFAVDLCWAAGRGLSVIRPAQGLDLLQRGLILAAQLGEPRRLARSLILQGSALVAMGGPLGALGARWLERATLLAAAHKDECLRGLACVFAGVSEVSGAGRWALARSHAELGLNILREHCSGVAWEQDMAMGVWLKAFEPSGEVLTLGSKAAEWGRDAAARGDVYTQNVAASFIVPYRLAEDDVVAARQQARVALADWHDIGFTVQHYHATRLEACCDLYDGDADGAWRRFSRDFPRFKATQLYRLSLSRIELLVLEAVIRLSLAASKDGKQHLVAVVKLIKRLEREVRNDCPPHATMLRAVVEVLSGERSAGAARLRRARDLYQEADMPVWAWSVSRRLGEITGTQSEIDAADKWFGARGVSVPARWVAQFVPAMGLGAS